MPYLIILTFFLIVPSANSSLLFYGNGVNDIDRVEIQIDDPANSNPGPPADIGNEDFTLEFWMKANSGNDSTGAGTSCGANYDWIYGNIIFDRDRFNQGRAYGVSIVSGNLRFGTMIDNYEAHTICGTTNILDGEWHHVAVQRRRSDGWMWLYVDGNLDASADGPDGDISYPDDGVAGNYCSGPCTNDPYLVIGAEKHDANVADYPAYSGYVDEVRLSNVLRYPASVPTQAFITDGNTVALYHFNEGSGTAVTDSSAATGGPSDGVINVGGSPVGPQWSTDSPFTTEPTQDNNDTENNTPNNNDTENNMPNNSASNSGSGVTDWLNLILLFSMLLLKNTKVKLKEA